MFSNSDYQELEAERDALRAQLKDIRSAFDVWQHAPNTPDMNMALCAAIHRALGTRPTSAPGTQGTSDPLHPTGRCTCGGEGICVWCMSHCGHCGAGLVRGRG